MNDVLARYAAWAVFILFVLPFIPERARLWVVGPVWFVLFTAGAA